MDDAAKRALPPHGADRPRRPVARVPRRRAARSTSRSCSRCSSSTSCCRRSSRASSHPFVIMLSVPLSMTGALFALWLDRRHAQHLQPDRARHAGRPHHQARHPDRRVRQPAARQGRDADRGRRRRRDAAPAADPDDHRRDGAGRAAAGAGAPAPAPKSRTQIGWVIVGGMSFGTLLTLFVVPTAYTLLARQGAHRGARHRPGAPVHAPAGHGAGAAGTPTDRPVGAMRQRRQPSCRRCRICNRIVTHKRQTARRLHPAPRRIP